MRTRDEIEALKARIVFIEQKISSLERSTLVTLFKDKDEFDGHGDYWLGDEVGWKRVDVSKLVKQIFNHLKLKYIPESIVPASVEKRK